jgi:hypothetical protein
MVFKRSYVNNRISRLLCIETSKWSAVDPKGNIVDVENIVVRQSRLIGRPRLRQLRTRSDSCRNNYIFAKQFDNLCFDFLTPLSEDHRVYQIGGMEFNWGPADTADVMGQVQTYEGSGYSVVLSKNFTNAAELVDKLKEIQWVNLDTRAVIVEFAVYNSFLNVITTFRLVLVSYDSQQLLEIKQGMN